MEVALMDYRVVGLETVEGTGLLYADVEFLEGGQVVHLNDFVMKIFPTRLVYTGPDPETLEDENVIYTEVEDEVEVNGEKVVVKRIVVKPEYLAEQETDVKAEVIANIERYLDRLESRGIHLRDTRTRSIKRDNSDPLGLMNKPGVSGLVGQVRRPARSVGR
jgi:hypothetical protein